MVGRCLEKNCRERHPKSCKWQKDKGDAFGRETNNESEIKSETEKQENIVISDEIENMDILAKEMKEH